MPRNAIEKRDPVNVDLLKNALQAIHNPEKRMFYRETSQISTLDSVQWDEKTKNIRNKEENYKRFVRPKIH